MLMLIRMEILFIVLFAYIRRIRAEKLQKIADAASSKAKDVLPVEAVAEKAKQVTSALVK